MATQIDSKAKTIMLFSQLSNINFNYSASIPDLEANSDRIETIISSDNVASQKIKALWDCDWQVVWGPALNYSLIDLPGKHHANNSMFVAKGMDKATHKYVYIVAIAGTNGLSWFEEFGEDIDVKKIVLWNAENPEQGHISRGSMTGLKKVLGKFKYGSNEMLMEFFAAEIQQIGADNIEIITCGHSLGGALSPLVALKIKETYPTIPVSTYPTAGPTSGDVAFAKYAENTLGANNYISVINTDDIVPMAWEHDTFSNISNVYNNDKFQHIELDSQNPKEKFILNFLTKYAEGTADLNYTRIAKETEQTFEGQPKNANGGDVKFMDEALYQHLDMYMIEFFKNENKFIVDFHELVHPQRS